MIVMMGMMVSLICPFFWTKKPLKYLILGAIFAQIRDYELMLPTKITEMVNKLGVSFS